MRTRTRLILLAAAALVLAAALAWLKRQVDIDRCLDAGKCWSASRDACDYEGTAECRPGPDAK